MTSVGAVIRRSAGVRSPRGEDGGQLAAGARWVATAIERREREPSQLGLVSLEAGRADGREVVDHVVREAIAICRRDAHEHHRGTQPRLARPTRARAAHDRYEREHAIGVMGRTGFRRR
jgi:hypothetical protein